MNRARRILFLTVILSLLVFGLFFKDRLVARAAEQGLEAAFGAQADIRGLRFQPLRGKISIGGLEVTDADDPARNLFELQDTVIDLNVNQLLRRRFVLEQVVGRGLRFGTERTSPGRVSAAEGRQAAEEPADAGGRRGSGGRLPSARELVETHYADLESPARLKELAETLKSSGSAWEARIPGLEAELAAAAAAAEKVLAVRAEDLGSPEEVAGALQSLAQAGREMADAAEAFRQAGIESAGERRRIEEALKRADSSRTADRETLLRLWNLPAAEGFPSLLLRRLLEPRLGSLSRYAVMAVEAASSLRGSADPRPSDARRRRGRVVAFPRSRYPRFLLQRLVASLEENGQELRAELEDLSSDMELWGRPATARVFWRDREGALELTGTLDLRSGAGQVLAFTLSRKRENARIALEGWPPLEGRHELANTVAVDRERRVEGELRLRAEVRAAAAGTELAGDPGSRILARSFAAPTELFLEGTYGVSPEGRVGLRVSGNLDELLSRAAAAELADLGGELERELAAELEALETENSRLIAGLAQEWTRLEEGGAALTELERALEEQRSSYSRRLQRLGGEALPEALRKLKLPGN